jgi:hypothetical protein
MVPALCGLKTASVSRMASETYLISGIVRICPVYEHGISPPAPMDAGTNIKSASYRLLDR